MKTKFGKFFAALSMVGLLASLSPSATAAQPVDTPEIRAAAQKAVTRSDHEAVAKFYEDAAKQMRVKVKEQKELLEHYENKSYLYGRQAQDLQSHAYAQVRDYEQAVEVNIREASLHRQMASKLDENHAASVTQDLAL
ncbi:MAG: hypothetical protein M3Q16_00895 [Pseudomonadota bacterium]|nr:hypothetical protein [Pseudomonadota bacterium]